MAISEARKKMIEEDAVALAGGGGANYNYVDKQRAEELGLGQYRTKVGDNFMRIVAPSVDEPFRFIVWRHQNIGPNGSTYLCLNKMYGERCPICECIAKLKMEDPKHPALDQIYAARRILMYVVDTTSEETEAEGPKWFDCPPSIYTAICDIAKAKRTGEVTDISHPQDGCSISFERKKKKGNPYSGFELEKLCSIDPSWHADLPDYEDILLLPDAGKLEMEIAGIVPGQRLVEEEKPSAGRRGRTAAPAHESRRRERTTTEVKTEEVPATTSRRARPAEDAEPKAPFDADAPVDEVEVDENVAEVKEAAPEATTEEKPMSRLDEIRARRQK